MPDLEDGEIVEVQGSGSNRYQLKNVGGVYSCSCPAWRNQSLGIEKRTCKHLRAYRGEQAETDRVGAAVPRSAATHGTGTSKAGSAATAPPVLLAHKYETGTKIDGWWMSEKLDGVRAYWDGKGFISRLGNPYLAPDWFVQGLPEVPLDGELWCGRKMFQRTTSIVRRSDRSDEWKKVTYLVFDAPAMQAPFEDRLAFCEQWMKEHEPPYARFHEHVPCKGAEHLRQELARVEALGGEGVMLRKPKSRYEVGRSSTLLKVKSFHDAEAKVIDHLAGEGRHAGRLGALLVEMPDGTRFSVGTGFSDAERESPPPIGSIITYKYQELSDGGVPRFPTYIGVRTDVAYPDPEPAEPVGAARSAAAAGAATATKVRTKATPRAKPAPSPAPAPKPAAVATKPAAAANPAAASKPSGGPRYFEQGQGAAAKFWEVQQQGAQHVTRFGKVGYPGQKRIKWFDSDEAASADVDRMVQEKIKQGFREKTTAEPIPVEE